MSLITLNSLSDMEKYLKDGSTNIYEFKMLGIYVDVKFNFDLFDTRNKRIKDGTESGLVVLKARKIKARNLIVDKIEAEKLKATSVTATYLFVRKVKVDVLECMNIESKKIKSRLLNTTILDCEKIKADYVDACELRNCCKIKAKKISLLTMAGGKIKAGEVSLNEKPDDQTLPSTRKWYNFLLWRDNNENKKQDS